MRIVAVDKFLGLGRRGLGCVKPKNLAVKISCRELFDREKNV
jgi:hypothetical protein